jgi:hypothetical protein
VDRKLLAFVVLVLVVLTAAAVLVTASRYAGPQGAATGGAGGCGGDPTEDADVHGHGSYDIVFEAEAALTPAQIVYHTLEEGQICGRVTIEPEDRVATFDNLCLTDVPPVVLDLDDAAAQAVMDGALKLLQQPCSEADCPPGSRVEVLTQNEETVLLPFESPLRESVEKVLSQVAEAGPPPAAAPPIGTLSLAPEAGAIFGSGAALPDSSPLKVDLICYASSKSVDLQAGAGPTMANQKLLKLFRTPGGTTAKFGSIGELPTDLPQDGDRDMVHHAQAGNGFVLENNITGGHTRVFVKEASTAKVVLEYQMMP